MPVYISMLRAINVGGRNVIKMAALKEMYESLGYSEVTTYIQSGNVVFKAKETKPTAVCASITAGIDRKFGVEVTVIVRQPKELASVIRKNPFVGHRGVDENRLHVTFLDTKPSPALVKALVPLTAKSSDEYDVVGKEIYIHCPVSYGKSLLTNGFFEKRLKVAATTRNWNTVNVLMEMAKNAEP